MINPVKKYEDNTDKIMPDIVRAAYRGRHDEVAALLSQGESVNSADDRDNLTLLHIACMQGDRRLVDVILNHDSRYGDLDYAATSRFRPRLAWQFAVNGNHLDIAERVHEAALANAAGTGRRPDWS